MKHKFKALSTVLLAIIMVFAMSISAFAASGDGSNLGTDTSINPDKSGTISDGGVREDGRDSGDKDANNKATHGTFTGVGNTVTLDKEIVIFNTRENPTVVYLPNIRYEYEVTAVDVDNDTGSEKYIIDEYGNKGAINDGDSSLQSGVTTAINNSNTPYVEFSNTDGISGTGMTPVTTPYVTTKTAGFAAEGHFNLTFNDEAFSKPGIYRYKVTETVTETNARVKAGVINREYKDYRYLDVYVQNKENPTATDKFEIYGYVCFEDTSKDKEFSALDNSGNIQKITAKTNGFVSNKNDDNTQNYSKTEPGVDIYETSNVKVQKVITGAMADKTHTFPFAAVLDTDQITKDPIVCYVKVAKGGNETTTANTNPTTLTGGDGTIGAATLGGQLKLGDEEFIYIYGIPGKTTATSIGESKVKVQEFNDTSEVYTVTGTYDGADKEMKSGSDTGNSVKMNASATGEFNAAQTILINNEKDDVVVTNKLNSISPTNVVMRYAPYLFILGAGIMLLMMSRRRKEEEE